MVRQQRAIQTREKILQAAAEIVADKGPGELVLSDLYRHANITGGALYFHFASKDELLPPIQAQSYLFMETLAKTSLDHDCDPIARLFGFTRDLALAVMAEPMVRASFRMSLERTPDSAGEDTPIFDQWRELLRLHLTEVQPAGSDALATLLASALIGTFTVATTSGQLTELPYRIEDLMGQLLPIVSPWPDESTTHPQ